MQNEKNYKEDVLKILSLFLIIVSVFTLFKIFEVYRNIKYVGQDVRNVISFSGEGEVFAVADVATFSFSVVEEGKTPTEAQELATEKMNKAIEYLKKQEIEDKDIKTSNYNVYPKYEWQREVNCFTIDCPRNNQVLIGYEVNQSIIVKVRNIDNAGMVLAGIGELGVNNISGLNFTIDDEDALKREARKLAIEDAKSKAKELAKDLNVKLVRIVNFSESGAYPYYATKAAFSDEMMIAGIGGGGAVPEIPVGENRISSNITITYEIR